MVLENIGWTMPRTNLRWEWMSLNLKLFTITQIRKFYVSGLILPWIKLHLLCSLKFLLCAQLFFTCRVVIYAYNKGGSNSFLPPKYCLSETGHCKHPSHLSDTGKAEFSCWSLNLKSWRLTVQCSTYWAFLKSHKEIKNIRNEILDCFL